MARLVAYLEFAGNCKEAMTFYQECLGGEMWMQTHGDSPMADSASEDLKNKVLHSQLENGNMWLMGADSMDPETLVKGGSIRLCLVCTSKEEIETLYSKLVQGGRVDHPLKEEFFGTYGQLTDKYGFGWMLQYSPNPPQS